MKNKLRFIMPRLIGATVIVGLAAFIIGTVFKLLLGITVLAGLITLAARAFGKRQKFLEQYGQNAMPGFGNWNAFGTRGAANNPIQPVNGYATQKGTSIVPIN